MIFVHQRIYFYTFSSICHSH